MKTAEEFLRSAKNAERLKYIIPKYSFHDKYEKIICDMLNEFRKEGMEEAFEAGEENISIGYERNMMIQERNQTFKEWYNNQIKNDL